MVLDVQQYCSRIGHHAIESKRSALLVAGREGLLTRDPWYSDVHSPS